jgi:acyl-CoA synthetase (NDP forming)/GNAT superfamily N-acetyltransferase
MPAAQDAESLSYDALLSDGTTVHIRPISSHDGDRLVRFHSGLSPESIYMRFFSTHAQLRPDEIRRFTHVDGRERMALVATVRDDFVGVARYDRLAADSDEAEVAFVVTDSFQGRGLGTLLLEHLAAYARTQGLTRFRAETLWQNTAMQHVFRNAGFRTRSTYADGVVEVFMEIAPTEEFVESVDRREELAELNSLGHVLRPRAMAVIGAGPDPGGVGHELFRHVVDGGFTGAVYPVHPDADWVAGHRAYPSIADVPDSLDLAVLAVPAPHLLDVVDQCAAKGVHALVLIADGTTLAAAETAPDRGQILARARPAGMRVVGPNCVGVINAHPSVSLNATLSPLAPETGPVAFASQSGGIGIAVLQEARRRHIGISSFVSMGDKADVSGNDVLQYWRHDPGTEVILLYLESFGNPRRFARIARRVSSTKPVIAVKAGRSPARRRPASSHTAAMARPDAVVEALFQQTGVIRVDTLEEMFDAAQVLSDQPRPAGRRVAVVGNAGGPGLLAADACEANGLTLPELSLTTQEALRSLLPGATAVVNPVDMAAAATASDYRRAIELTLADDGIDAIVAVLSPPLVSAADDVAAAIAAAASMAADDGQAKPVVANFLGMSPPPEAFRLGPAKVPCFCFPEPAVRALARACDYADWRRRPIGHTVVLTDLDVATARKVVNEALADDPSGRWLSDAEAARLLVAYGIEIPSSVPDGMETVVGVIDDALYGPLIMFGLGGSATEPLPDRAFRTLPLTDVDARDLVQAVRRSPLQLGDGGRPPVDLAALEALLLRVARLADDLPEVAEMDLDPVVCGPEGTVPAKARIKVAPSAGRVDQTIRRLR